MLLLLLLISTIIHDLYTLIILTIYFVKCLLYKENLYQINYTMKQSQLTVKQEGNSRRSQACKIIEIQGNS